MLALLVAIPFTSGCARTLVQTWKVADGSPTAGVVYFLPKRLVRLQITQTPSQPGQLERPDQVSLTLLGPLPDRSQAFIAVPQHTASAADEVKIETTPSGLLKAVHTESEDEIGDIILKVAQAAAQIAKLAAGFPAADSIAHTESFIFDPSDAAHVKKLNSALTDGYHVEVTSLAAATGGGASVTGAVSGIVYRRATPYLLQVRKKDRTVLSEQVALPNAGPLAVLELKGGSFVRTIHDLQFEQGELTAAFSNRPSEILGFASILPDTLKTIASIPTELIQFRINLGSKERELLDTQRALIESQAALLEAKKQLEERGGGRSGDAIQGDGL